MEPATDFTLEALENLEPLVNPVRQYRNRSKKKKQSTTASGTGKGSNSSSSSNANEDDNGPGGVKNDAGSAGDGKSADVFAAKLADDNNIDRTKLVRTYNVKLRIKRLYLYKCFDCDSCFTSADFLELHEKSHHVATLAAGAAAGGVGGNGNPSGTSSRNDDIDLAQEEDESMDASDMMIVKQNAWWFAGEDDFYEGGDGPVEQNGENYDTIQLDCTVEERGGGDSDVSFDRTKCARTYNVVKYKVKKKPEPVGKCEKCERLFYTADSLQLHQLEHERFMDFDAIEPKINIDSPTSVDDSTLVLDENFFQALSEMDASDILEVSEGTIETRRSPTNRRTTTGEITFECKIIPRRTSRETNGGSPTTTLKRKQSVSPTHQPSKFQFQCELCSKRFRFRAALNVHLRTIHNTSERPFPCAECGRRFASKARLFLHSYGHARERRSEFCCRDCGASFGRPRQLLEHLQQGHHGSVSSV